MQREFNVKPKKKLARKIIEEYIHYYHQSGIRETIYSLRNNALKTLENNEDLSAVTERDNINFDTEFLELYFEAAYYLYLIKRDK